MTLTAFCSACQRTVYIDRAEPVACPVCASPLVIPMDEKSLDPDEPRVALEALEALEQTEEV